MDLVLLADYDPDGDFDHGSAKVIDIGGRKLHLTPPMRLESHASPRPFVCISYTWGPDRLGNPLFPSLQMSSITLDCLTAALAQYSPETKVAFWIDAFCVPPSQPQRSITLSSMGLIYALSQEVIACLSPQSKGTLQKMLRTDRLDEANLAVLADDLWIQSVWTYQEVANSRSLRFVAQHRLEPTTSLSQASVPAVDGDQFLNCLGEALVHSRDHLTATSHDTLPSLEAFEDMLLDWKTGGFTERPLLQILANMDHRVASEPQNTFYAIIGCLVHRPQHRRFGESMTELAAALIRICEEKGDYSFIFTSTEREAGGWRPRPEVLTAVLVWHCYGKGLSGTGEQYGWREEGKTWLGDVVSLTSETGLGDEGRAHVARLVTQFKRRGAREVHGDGDLLEAMHEVLVKMGFSGSESALLFDKGAFFPQQDVGDVQGWTVHVSTGLRWTFGHPGLLHAHSPTGGFYCAGVFVGEIKGEPVQSVCLQDG